MFNLESAKQQIQKNKIENAILKTKIEFWEKLTDENEMDLFDKVAEYIIDGVTSYFHGANEAEKATIDQFRTKIESLEKQLYALA